MRILADENISGALVEAMENLGHQVFWIAREKPGILDIEVAEIAATDIELMITFDKNLAAVVASQRSCGVMLLRLVSFSPDQVATTVSQILQRNEKLSSSYVVVSENAVRVRPYLNR